MPTIKHDIQDEARSGFDLRARLEGRQLRTSTIELFTDEVTGAKHLENEQKLEAYKLILEAASTEGLVLDEDLSARLATSKAAMAARADEQSKLLEELHKTSYVLELRATPRIVKEAATRAAYKAAKASPGNIAAEQIAPFNNAYAAYIISKMVMSFRDNSTETSTTMIDVQDAQALREFLPDAQYARLEAAVDDLQNKNTISEAVTASADF